MKKIRKYQELGIVDPKDSVIIAINTGEMRDSDLADQAPPLAVRALLGIGGAAFRVSVDIGSSKMKTNGAEIVFPKQIAIRKTDQTTISTEGMKVSPEISGVLTSTRHLVDMNDSGNDIKILLNPYS